jgi:hypothetical protein
MKAILLSIAILFTVVCCNAQPSGIPDAAIELRLQLIGKKNSGHTALNVLAINHLAKDIYIRYISYLNFHLYRQSDTGWTELALYEHYPYPPGVHGTHQDVRRGNDVTDSYKGLMNAGLLERKKMVDSFYNQDQSGQKASGSLRALIKGLPPVFLRSGETINLEFLIALDDLKPGNYKISYGNEEWDAKGIEMYNQRLMLLPENVFTYSRYISKRLLANTLYYSIIE